MTSFGQITVTDLNTWQARALQVLTDLQHTGMKAGRHPLDWSLSTNGELHGGISRYDDMTPTDIDRRAVFEEWVHVLGGTEPREAFRSAGSIRLTSDFKVATDRGDVRGILAVAFDTPDDH